MSELSEILGRYKGKVLDAEAIATLTTELTTPPDRSIDLSTLPATAARGFVFAAERYADCLHELKPLHAAHWRETEKHRHNLQLNMDYPGFLRMERAGRLVLFTIRQGGELVGHTTMKLSNSMHSQTLVANEDSLFLREDKRGNLFMILQFLKYVAETLGEMGVAEIRVSTKLVNGADKLLVRAGFKPFAIQLVKMTGNSHVF